MNENVFASAAQVLTTPATLMAIAAMIGRYGPAVTRQVTCLVLVMIVITSRSAARRRAANQLLRVMCDVATVDGRDG